MARGRTGPSRPVARRPSRSAVEMVGVTPAFIDGGSASRVATTRPRYVSIGIVVHSDGERHRQIRIGDARLRDGIDRRAGRRRRGGTRTRRTRGVRRSAEWATPPASDDIQSAIGVSHAPAEIATTSKRAGTRQRVARRRLLPDMSPSAISGRPHAVDGQGTERRRREPGVNHSATLASRSCTAALVNPRANARSAPRRDRPRLR